MLLYVLVCAMIAVARAQNVLQVNTTEGMVQGARATDGDYFTFYGVFYASVPTDGRFKAPTAAPLYPGLFHAINSNVICAQPTERGLVGVENCLTLNIFTTGNATRNPVVVWLVGEEYETTDTNLRSFRRLVEEKVVVVQVNYRLSIFGFLCLGVPEAPGNTGLRDVVAALKWIQKNIAGFGGDPNNVSLFGHGSGAAMVDLITMSPLGNGLIHKAIAQSGSALAPWAISYDPVGMARAVGAKMGYSGKTNEQLAILLANTDLTVLINSLTNFTLLNNTALFAPCIEDVSLNPNGTFLADTPINLLRAGNFSDIPYIAGYTDREGTIRAQEAAYDHWLEKMQANFTQFLPVDLDFGTNHTAVEKLIREYYFAQRVINMETIEDYLDYHGDTMILVSVIRGARERALKSKSPVRLYEFAYRGTMNSDWTLTMIPLTGARHGSVLNFLLDFDLRPEIDTSAMRSIVGRFVGFFQNGNPVPVAAVNNTVIWEPLTNSTIMYLLYGGESNPNGISTFQETIRSNPHQQRMTFWNDLYFKYYKAPRSSADKVLGLVLMVCLGQVIVRLF